MAKSISLPVPNRGKGKELLKPDVAAKTFTTSEYLGLPPISDDGNNTLASDVVTAENASSVQVKEGEAAVNQNKAPVTNDVKSETVKPAEKNKGISVSPAPSSETNDNKPSSRSVKPAEPKAGVKDGEHPDSASGEEKQESYESLLTKLKDLKNDHSIYFQHMPNNLYIQFCVCVNYEQTKGVKPKSQQAIYREALQKFIDEVSPNIYDYVKRCRDKASALIEEYKKQ